MASLGSQTRGCVCTASPRSPPCENLPDSDEREIKWTDPGRAAGSVPRRSPCSLVPRRSISSSGWGLFLGLSPAGGRLSPSLLPGESLLLSLLASP